MPSLEERFWAKVPTENEGCWEWLGGRDLAGYGRLRMPRGEVKAHRVAYELTYGHIPDGMCVCHSCDNPSCVRPDHLFLGSIGDNNRDMYAKGRASQIRARGTDHGSAVLTEDLVREIRKRKAAGETYAAIEESTGVKRVTACAAVTRRTWAWLDLPAPPE